MSMDKYSGDAEKLHTPIGLLEKPVKEAFCNPGTPASPLVTEADRKSGRISDAADAALKSNLTTGAPSQQVSWSTKGSQDGKLPSGK